jgi:hypothetical protein
MNLTRTVLFSLITRDVGSKLLSFELLLHFLEYWSDEQEAIQDVPAASRAEGDQQSVHTLAFAIRRMVVPALLSNTRCGLEDARVFRRMIRTVSELWCSPIYRKHCKVELGILIDHFVLKMLQLGPQLLASNRVDLWSEKAQISLLIQQVEVMKEVKSWCENPKDVIELFLNFDTDLCSEITGPMQGTHWKIFQRLCTGLSNIAEQCGDLIGEQILENQTKIMSESAPVGDDSQAPVSGSMNGGSNFAVDKTATREAAKLLRKTSLETISQIVKSLAISAAASAGKDYSNMLVGWTGLDLDQTSAYSSEAANNGEGHPPSQPSSNESPTPEKPDPFVNRLNRTKPNGEEEVVKYWSSAIAADHQGRLSTAVPSREESLQVALEIARRKSLKKAVDYLIASNSLSPAPRDVANFLRINKESLDPSDLGNYLSEGGTGGAESEMWRSIRHLYVRAISFVGMYVEEG